MNTTENTAPVYLTCITCGPRSSTTIIATSRSRAWGALGGGPTRRCAPWITGHKKAVKRRVRQSLRDRGLL